MKVRDSATAETLVAELEALVSEFAAVRKAKPYARAPFPVELLERASELDSVAPKLGVLRRLQLNADKVRARLRVARAATRAVAKEWPLPSGRRSKGGAQGPSFVEIPLSTAAPLRVVTVTVDRGEGLRITLEVSSDRAESAALLLEGLIGGAA
jgi:hypothetical protein